MARTRKDQPLWIRAIEWAPVHWRCQHAWYRHPPAPPCTLPPEPVRERPARPQAQRGCVWLPIHPRRRSTVHYIPPRHCWYPDLQRRRVRELCRQATRHADTDIPNRARRTSLKWNLD